MAEPTGTPAAPAAPPAPAPAAPAPAADETSGMTLEQMRERLRAVNAEAANRRHETQAEKAAREKAEAELASLKKAEADRAAKEAEAQGNFKKLHEDSQKRIAELEAELAGTKPAATKYKEALAAKETALRAELGDVASKVPADKYDAEDRVSMLEGLKTLKTLKAAPAPAPETDEKGKPKVPAPARVGATTTTQTLTYAQQVSAISRNDKLTPNQKKAALLKLKQEHGQ